MAKCKKCPAEIDWCRTEGGQWMPVDPGYNERGNLIELDDRGPQGETIVSPATLFNDDPGRRRMPHWATCPNAEEFKTDAR